MTISPAITPADVARWELDSDREAKAHARDEDNADYADDCD